MFPEEPIARAHADLLYVGHRSCSKRIGQVEVRMYPQVQTDGPQVPAPTWVLGVLHQQQSMLKADRKQPKAT
jgi:hypothetical protein